MGNRASHWLQRVEYECPRCQEQKWAWKIAEGFPCLKCTGNHDLQQAFEARCAAVSAGTSQLHADDFQDVFQWLSREERRGRNDRLFQDYYPLVSNFFQKTGSSPNLVTRFLPAFFASSSSSNAEGNPTVPNEIQLQQNDDTHSSLDGEVRLDEALSFAFSLPSNAGGSNPTVSNEIQLRQLLDGLLSETTTGPSDENDLTGQPSSICSTRESNLPTPPNVEHPIPPRGEQEWAVPAPDARRETSDNRVRIPCKEEEAFVVLNVDSSSDEEPPTEFDNRTHCTKCRTCIRPLVQPNARNKYCRIRYEDLQYRDTGLCACPKANRGNRLVYCPDLVPPWQNKHRHDTNVAKQKKRKRSAQGTT